jgi:hypothetical protein
MHPRMRGEMNEKLEGIWEEAAVIYARYYIS